MLCVVAIVMAAAEFVGLFVRPLESYEQVWLGYEFRGEAARIAAVPHVVVYVLGAWGLWQLRPWARKAAMVYFAYVILSFLIWGVRGYGSEGVLYVMAWQIFVLPLVTFCLMYLYRGERYFARQ